MSKSPATLSDYKIILLDQRTLACGHHALVFHQPHFSAMNREITIRRQTISGSVVDPAFGFSVHVFKCPCPCTGEPITTNINYVHAVIFIFV